MTLLALTVDMPRRQTFKSTPEWGESGTIEAAPNGGGTPIRGLTHSSELSREGLAVDTTRTCRACGKTILQRRNKLYCDRQCERSFLSNDDVIYIRLTRRLDTSDGPDACHPWTGWCDASGYGIAQINSRKTRVGRWLLGYLRRNQLIPSEEACHHCDNPPCCNPAHLYVGNHAQNMRDMSDRGRRTLAEAAKAVCDGCPALTACEAYCREYPRETKFGIWAGKTARQRGYDHNGQKRKRVGA